jgi:hypothetical protein
MDHSSRNQGELSLLDLIESMKSPDGNKERPSATIAIALNEERHRREVCVLYILIYATAFRWINLFIC